MKKIIAVLILVFSVSLYAYLDTAVFSSYGSASIVTDSTVTDMSKPFRLTNESNVKLVSSLSGGSASLRNTYYGYIGDSWVILYRDTLSAVGVKITDISANVPASQIKIQRVITNASGTQTLNQQIRAY